MDQALIPLKPTSNQDLIMKKTTSFLFVFLAFVFCLCPALFADRNGTVAGYSGAVTITIPDSFTESGVTYTASANSPIYKVVSAGVSGEPVFSGFIESVGEQYYHLREFHRWRWQRFQSFCQGSLQDTVKVPILTAVLPGLR